ncbi:hypothetical protein L228DRAFT_250356 [Xylona heveae TC161]|uniref:Uncharacterized protein n=1 Tax=Xylona heveae (strain CBS 132557 / TC161) TaxID=1328760 RepID=A0A165A4K4_XYLHT|nr:hypothetical protein L228DRAFT_250356 [Xylona heveae TC161]KZF19939.1 hypothetical protein L228DRAFT_250356 [Xylona heveae TC161]
MDSLPSLIEVCKRFREIINGHRMILKCYYLEHRFPELYDLYNPRILLELTLPNIQHSARHAYFEKLDLKCLTSMPYKYLAFLESIDDRVRAIIDVVRSFGIEQERLYRTVCLLWFYLSLDTRCSGILKNKRALLDIPAAAKRALYRLTWKIAKGMVEDRLRKGTLWKMLRGLNPTWEIAEVTDDESSRTPRVSYYLVPDCDGRAMPRREVYRSGLLAHLVQQRLMTQTPDTLLVFLSSFPRRPQYHPFYSECIITQNNRKAWHVQNISGYMDRVKELRFYVRAPAHEIQRALQHDSPWRESLVERMERFPDFAAKPATRCYLHDDFCLDRLFGE